MITVFIGIGVLGGGAIFLWFVLSGLGEQEEAEHQDLVDPLKIFCAQYGFEPLSNTEGKKPWQFIKEYIVSGWVESLISSMPETPALIACRGSSQNPEYIFVVRHICHKNANTRRFIVGLFVQQAGWSKKELFVTKKTAISSLATMGSQWKPSLRQGKYVAYTKGRDQIPEIASRLLDILSLFGEPPLCISIDNKGVLIYTVTVEKAPAFAHDYERLLQLADALRKAR